MSEFCFATSQLCPGTPRRSWPGLSAPTAHRQPRDCSHHRVAHANRPLHLKIWLIHELVQKFQTKMLSKWWSRTLLGLEALPRMVPKGGIIRDHWTSIFDFAPASLRERSQNASKAFATNARVQSGLPACYGTLTTSDELMRCTCQSRPRLPSILFAPCFVKLMPHTVIPLLYPSNQSSKLNPKPWPKTHLDPIPTHYTIV